MRPEALPILKAVYEVRFDGLKIVPNENADASPKLKRFDPVPVALVYAMLYPLDPDAFQIELEYLFQEGLVRSANSRSAVPIGCFIDPDGRKIELLLEQTDKPGDRLGGSLLNGEIFCRYTGEQYTALVDGEPVSKGLASVVSTMQDARLKSGATQLFSDDRPRIVEYIELTKAGLHEADASPDDTDTSKVHNAIIASDDYRWLKVGNTEYSFTYTQSLVVRVLVENYRKGVPELSDGRILEKADLDGEQRLVNIFRDSSAWGTLIIQGGTKGTRRLSIPPAK